MRISVIDGSNYFKGLLLLIRKDGKLLQPEIDLMKRIGSALGFEREFCENAINEILDNAHIIDVPVVFSTKELAAKFMNDGLSLALSDNHVHPLEEQWLRAVIVANGLDLKLFSQQKNLMALRRKPLDRMEVEGLTVEY